MGDVVKFKMCRRIALYVGLQGLLQGDEGCRQARLPACDTSLVSPKPPGYGIDGANSDDIDAAINGSASSVLMDKTARLETMFFPPLSTEE
jgi:hypothetical protein